ncbi:DUF819 domain-containing protein [Teredinibacter waterburyi]|jgi:Predicted integral membrane protein|uniref:DUF819 family protein n=1 Tax=Teredinibacter waterburyi TaxID=1500538 RepID=UPI00165FF44F|nr:DUF819 family protein [Teredinibacter waterburyi]
MITNDATIAGLLFLILGAVFYTHSSSHRFFKAFYSVVPAILLCYFLPALLANFHIIDTHNSKIYFFASRYLLPAALVLLCLSIDLKAIINLGPKALILFLVGTTGVVIGGPIALLLLAWLTPEAIQVQGVEQVWRGMTTLAGSWIGGSANQTAMREIFHASNDIFTAMVAVDVLIANCWMAVLLVLAGKSQRLDRNRGIDTKALDALVDRVEQLERSSSRIPATADLMLIGALAFGITGLAHFCADGLAPWFLANFPNSARFSLTSGFFWLVVIATTGGVALSFTKARKLEGAGASKIGTVFIYILVAAIGTHMNLGALLDAPILFLLGAIWMAIHASLMLFACKLLKAPLFYMAVGSQANIGGAASAPVVAAAFHPSLAPVGVLLAVLGYAVGTYAAWLCGQLLRASSAFI